MSIEPHRQHPSRACRCDGPQPLNRQRCVATANPHPIDRSGKVGCRVSEGAVQVEQDGTNILEFHGLRAATR